MLRLDGRTGGGQLLRTALSLSVLTGTAFELDHVRSGRPTPGVQPQHLAAIRVMAALGRADVDGATVGAETVTFRPESLVAESTSVEIGTAGSVTLLFDTVLPLATRVDRAFDLTATGGTDVKWTPTIGYLDHVKCPLLARFGVDLGVAVDRTGYYPAGGGSATLHVRPSTADRIALGDRGPLDGVAVYSKASEALADAEVAGRQADRVEARLADAGLPVTVEDVAYHETRSTGSSVLLRAEYRRSLAGFDELGERGKPSEAVADDAVDRFLEFHHGSGVVDPFMADQLLVPLALAGGTIRAPRLTDHVASNVAVIGEFGFDLKVDECDDETVIIESAG